jgi:choline-sulfatase
VRILYIDLDCCRADHLGCNGYLRDTSPNIDAIADEGVSFTRCYCSNSPCVPSRASLFSGRFGFNNGVVAHHGGGERFRYEDIYDGHRRDPQRPMLAAYLWENGFKTATFSSFHDRHAAWWFTAGWAEIQTCTRKRGYERAEEVNAVFLPWLGEHGREDDWFVHLHYWDLHSEYRTPVEWVQRFHGLAAPDWPDQATIDRQQAFYGPCSAVDLYAAWEGLTGGDTSRPVDYMPDAIETTQDFKMLIDGYDASLAYADHHIGQVLEVLDGLGVLNDTAIIIGGDHGDSFGEHGQYLDHGIANEAVHNVPMIVRWPGVTMPADRCESLIYALDLGPTLCELLDLPVPQGWDGRSFAAALHGEDYGGWPFLVWDHAIYTITRAIRTPEWLMIQVLHPGLYPYDDGVMLHDMHEDLHQEINSATEQLVVVAELNSLISEWRHEQILKSGGPDPLERMLSVGPFAYYTPEQMFARLERTNRSHIVPELRARLNRYHRQSHH